MSIITWMASPGSGDYNTASNWSPSVAPVNSFDDAFFGTSTITSLSINTGTMIEVGDWIFNRGASQYNFTITNSRLDFNGAGISVNGGSVDITLLNSILAFQNNSTAGSASIANSDFILFHDLSTAGTANITNSFKVQFDGYASAGNAMIHTAPAAFTYFQGFSTGGNAQLVTDPGGTVDFSQSVGPAGDHKLTVGSIAGYGTYYLGQDQLTVGSNGLPTEVVGPVDDEGSGGGTGASLVKVGPGTLKLSGGNNTYSGGTTLEQGTLDLAVVGAAGTGAITFSGPAELKIESAALSGNAFASAIHGFASGDTIDLSGLPFAPGAFASYAPSLHALSVTSSSTTITFDDVETTGTGLPFAVLDDHAGGSRVVLATIATAKHELVDATHSPPGQPLLTNGSNLIVAEGANEIIKPPGGNNTEVARGRGDILFGSGPGDNFVFESLKASPPGHPDEIIGFKHPLHDLIDLYDLRLAVPGDQPLQFIGGLIPTVSWRSTSTTISRTSSRS